MTDKVMEQDDKEFSDAFAEFSSEKELGDEPSNISFENSGEPVGAGTYSETQELEATNAAPESVDWEEKAKALETESNDWKHRFQSDAGRVGALQRKINLLESNAASSELANQPSDMTANSNDSPPDLAEFKEDYPEIHRGVESYMESELERRTAKIKSDLEQQLVPVSQMIEQQETAAQVAALEHNHPDWQQLANDEAFQGWVVNQPEQIQSMADSISANDVSYVLSTYKTQHNAPVQTSVDGIAQKRERRLRDSTAIASRGTAATTPLAEDDFSSNFKYFADKMGKN